MVEGPKNPKDIETLPPERIKIDPKNCAALKDLLPIIRTSKTEAGSVTNFDTYLTNLEILCKPDATENEIKRALTALVRLNKETSSLMLQVCRNMAGALGGEIEDPATYDAILPALTALFMPLEPAMNKIYLETVRASSNEEVADVTSQN